MSVFVTCVEAIIYLVLYYLHGCTFKVMYNRLTDREHRTEVNDLFSDFIDLLLGVPQVSILEPLLFNIYICNLFFFVEEDNVTSYANDTTPYSNGKNVVMVLENIETKGKEVFSWFSLNYLIANRDKSQLRRFEN